MADVGRWEERYRTADTPWDTGRPSSELVRVIGERAIPPCRAIDLGCGTGTNAAWLANQGFDVTGVDLSGLAIEQAVQRARSTRTPVRFLSADVFQLPDLGEPFAFFFDRGCYHVVRRENADGYVNALQRITAPGALGLVLAGNAREKHDPGPPVVSEAEIRAELGRCFEIVDLHEFRFDQVEKSGIQFLGWSCLLKRT